MTQLLIKRFSPDGVATEFIAEGDVTIGRAGDCQIQLPGLMVSLRHLRLSPISAQCLRYECLSAIGVEVNGLVDQRDGQLAPGDQIRIGGHRLKLGITASAEPVLILEVAEQDPKLFGNEDGAITSLGEAGWKMRRPAVLGGALVLALMLLLPLFFRWVHLPTWLGVWLPSDQVWSSGTMSNGHKQFGNQCETCHESLFDRVRDQACLNCHSGISQHSEDTNTLKASGLDVARCATCHLEHGSAHAVLPAHPKLCVGCHAKPGQHGAQSGLAAVSGFDDHPYFRHTVSELIDGKLRTTRLAAGESQPKDHSGLIFPHDLHLNPKGIRGSEGKDLLTCASCHRPDATGGFQTLSFKDNCQSCHQLDTDFAGTQQRLPHGDSQKVRDLLELALQNRPESGMEPEIPASRRSRPGLEQASTGRLDTAPEPEVNRVFRYQVCGKCHEVQGEGDRLEVRPPRLRKTWWPEARFSHEPHQWVNCDSCHKAAKSADSNDLLLPNIDGCRLCHAEIASRQGIDTTCIDCHRFHQQSAAELGKSLGGLANDNNHESEDIRRAVGRLHPDGLLGRR